MPPPSPERCSLRVVVLLVLVSLVTGRNFPTALPTDLDTLQSVNEGYTGTVPSQIGFLTGLTLLDLTLNQFNSTLPSELGTLTAVATKFSFAGCALTGALPTQLGKMTAIQADWLLYSNQFSGDIPSQVGRMSQLTSGFNLISNALNGTIPTEIGDLTSMGRVLKVHSNQLVSSLPTEFGRLTGLSDVWTVRDTKISGPVPTELGRWTAFFYNFRSSNMKLSGSIPTQLGLLTKMLSKFELYDNRLTGAIPTELGLMDQMQTYFYLDSNKLSSELPTELGGLENLKIGFELHDNLLNDALPTELGRLTGLTSNFGLFNNEFCGDVPTEVEDLSAGVTSSWLLTTGNSFGTRCCQLLDQVCAPTLAPTLVPTITCDVGEYFSVDDDGNQECEPCEAGKYRNSTNVPAVCTQCESGKYRKYSSISATATSCDTCSTGQVPSSDQASCDTCALGRFTVNSTSCVDCPSGKYADEAKDDACDSCGAGFYTGSESGASSCLGCSAGKFSTAKSVNCSDCSAGKFSNTRAEECSDCAEAYYTDSVGQSSCLKCSSEFGVSFTSKEGSTSCDACVAGYYMNTLMSTCEECPNTVDCDKIGVKLTSLNVHAGYFRFTANSTDVYECPFPSNCLGGNSTDQDDQCREGASGPLCSVCDSGHYLEATTELCEPCNDVVSSGSFALFAVAVVVLLLAASVYYVYERGHQDALRTDAALHGRQVKSRMSVMRFQYEKEQAEMEAEAKDDTEDKHNTAQVVLQSFVTTVQTMTILLTNHKAAGGRPAPKIFSAYFDFWSFCRFDFGAWLPGLGCIAGGFGYDLVGQTLGFVGVCTAACLLYLRRRKQGDPRAPKVLKHAVTFVLVLLPAVSTTIFTALRCESYDDGEFNYLLADLSIDCDGGEYTMLRAYALLMLVLLPFGLPVFALLQLLRLKPIFDQIERNTYHRHPVLQQHPLRPLFENLEPPFAWWHGVYDLERRLVLTCATLVTSTLSTFTTMSITFASLALCLHEQLQPYEEDLDDKLASAQNWQTLLLINLLVLGDANMFKTNVAYETAGAALMSVNLIMLLTIFRELVPSRNDLVRSARTSSLKDASKGMISSYLDTLQEARQSASDRAALFRRGLSSRRSQEFDLAEVAWEPSQHQAVDEEKSASERPMQVIELADMASDAVDPDLQMLSPPSRRELEDQTISCWPEQGPSSMPFELVPAKREEDLAAPPDRQRIGRLGPRSRSKSRGASEDFDFGGWFSQSSASKDTLKKPRGQSRSKTPFGWRSRSKSAQPDERRNEDEEKTQEPWFTGLFN